MSLIKLRFAGILACLCSLPVLAAPVPVSESRPSLSTPSATNAKGSAPGAPEGQARILLEQIDSLQQEVLQLRGLVEKQANALQRLSHENRDRYLDLDRRISKLLESVGSGGAPEAGTETKGARTDTKADAQQQTVAPHPTKAGNTPEAAPPGSSNPVPERLVYRDAFRLIRARKFDEAIRALDDYIRRFPTGIYADNARYWLGEVYFAQGKLKQARDAFEAVLKDYPTSNKVPDALYKLGRVFDQLGDKAQSEKSLKSVIGQYPQSSAARLADVYLRSLQDKKPK